MMELTQDAVILIAIMIGMTALTILYLARPWLRRSVEAGVDRSNFTVQVYRDQLAELETDMNEQRLSEEQYSKARQELERSMMDDIGQRPQSQMPLPPPEKTYNAGLWALVLVAVALPVLALILYGVLHISIQAIAPAPVDDGSNTAQTSNSRGGPSPGDPNFSIDEMVGRLATRLQKNPRDAKGWGMLGRSYIVLKRYPEAAEAYGTSYRLRAEDTLRSEDADMIANYVEALSLANDNSLEGRVRELVEQALTLNSQNEKALWLGGMGAFRDKDYKLATSRWESLYDLTPRSSEMSQMLQGAIEEAKVRSGELLIVPEKTTREAVPEGAEPTAPAAPSPIVAPASGN